MIPVSGSVRFRHHLPADWWHPLVFVPVGTWLGLWLVGIV